MLTISQLAGYAGVTVRAVRHYHAIGLLPEPPRNSSGYRTYDAAAVVRLIRIHTLAGSGVPLARVQELLDADPDAFAEAIDDIDEDLRREIRRIQDSRKRLAELAAGSHPALPASVVGYLDRLRQLGVDERYLDLEGDAWIMVAAQMPDQIDAVIADKHAELDDPETVRLYRLLSQAVDWTADDPRIIELADCLEALLTRAVEAGATGELGLDDRFVDLIDANAVEISPVARKLRSILEERGWDGWVRIQRTTPSDPHRAPSTIGDHPEPVGRRPPQEGASPRRSAVANPRTPSANAVDAATPSTSEARSGDAVT